MRMAIKLTCTHFMRDAGVEKEFEMIEGNRDDLERRALEAIFVNRDQLPELMRRLEPAASGKLRVVTNDAPLLPVCEQVILAP
jgi:hypothetical protein